MVFTLKILFLMVKKKLKVLLLKLKIKTFYYKKTILKISYIFLNIENLNKNNF